MTQPSIRPRIGLALGSGSARGWAHVGVLQALLSAGIVPDVVCGASVGAIVGAAYATGQLERFEAWVRGMDRRAVMSYMDFNLGGGMLKGQRLAAYMREHFDAQPIEALATRFAAVATALHTGEEVWLRSGSGKRTGVRVSAGTAAATAGWAPVVWPCGGSAQASRPIVQSSATVTCRSTLFSFEACIVIARAPRHL